MKQEWIFLIVAMVIIVIVAISIIPAIMESISPLKISPRVEFFYLKEEPATEAQAPTPPVKIKDDPYVKYRKEMVETQIKARGITNEKVLKAMQDVPRHLFVPEEYRDQAYGDHPLPIGYGQTISQPYIVALMTQYVEPDKDKKVLEIGTGSGYQAAVLAEIVKEVYTIEIIPELSQRAMQTLKDAGYENVYTKIGDGYYGWEEYAPFDAIMITAAAPHIPPPLLKQLKDGGILVLPLGSPLTFQTLTIIRKQGDNLDVEYSIECRFVPMTGAIEKIQK